MPLIRNYAVILSKIFFLGGGGPFIKRVHITPIVGDMIICWALLVKSASEGHPAQAIRTPVISGDMIICLCVCALFVKVVPLFLPFVMSSCSFDCLVCSQCDSRWHPR